MKRTVFKSLAFPFFQVPHNNVFVIERLGKYTRTVDPGLHFKLPFVEYAGYCYSLKEQNLNIYTQSAITKDNVMIKIDGVLYYMITDPLKASYDIYDPATSLIFMAQTCMRSEIGKMDFDTTLSERAILNANIKAALNQASKKWGITCMRYEIKDIKPPDEMRNAMNLEGEYERIKRNEIVQSEGLMRAKINVAKAERESLILVGEGNSEKILQEARGLVISLQAISKSLKDPKTAQAMKLKLCMNYLNMLKKVLQSAQTIMLPKGQKSDLLDTVVAGISLYNQKLKEDPSLVNEETKKAKNQVEEKIEEFKGEKVLDSTDTDRR
jgi:regulator of protease activity HflC (stomatin/prohibitin superfamily)